MTISPPYSTLHSGPSESDLELERFEYRAGPQMSVHKGVSDTEMGPSETNGTTVHTQHPQTDSRAKRDRFDWNGSWAWEIGSLTLAVVGLALLVAFLVTVNSTPYADWQYTASPNTVVSIIVTITKAALLVPVSSCLGQLKWNLFQNPAPLYHMQVLDQASRGPWGSMEILLRGIFGSKTGILTYIGAALTLLALAVDPFAQQILTFPSRTVPALNATAFAQASQGWDSVGWEDEGTKRLELPPALLTAIISGLMQTHSPLEPQCNANSCDFPEFFSLGMCRKCEDVTARTDQTCQVGQDGADMVEDIPVHPAFKEIPTNCSYRSPSNFSFDFEHIYGIAYGTVDGLNPDPYENDNLTVNLNYWSLRSRAGGPILDIQAPIVSLVEVDYTNPFYYVASNATSPPTKPLVTECAVYICERRYAASSYQPTARNSTPAHAAETQELIARNAHDASPYSYDPAPFHLDPPSGSATLSENSTYNIDQLTFNNFEPLMLTLFNATDEGQFHPPTADTLRLASLLRMRDIGEVLDSMATSVTDTFRTKGDGEDIRGRGFRDETYIHVRWPWIVLPVVVTLGSLVLLLATAVGSKRKAAVLWKCMVLPLLSSRLEATPGNEISSVRSADGMTAMSKKMRAMVVQDEGSLVFKEK